MRYSPEYRSWRSMKARCTNKNDPAFKNYGGRGIKVCARWINSFENFYFDMGPRDVGMELERTDNDGDYAPDNCRWSTVLEQARNRRTNVMLTHNGCTLTMAEWARVIGITRSSLWKRLRVWPLVDALTVPAVLQTKRPRKIGRYVNAH